MMQYFVTSCSFAHCWTFLPKHLPIVCFIAGCVCISIAGMFLHIVYGNAHASAHYVYKKAKIVGCTIWLFNIAMVNHHF